MFLSALIMGFAGSLHCAGMCSPLAMTVTNMSRSVLSNRIFYNLGRITTYGLLGATVATIGYIIPISAFQNVLSFILGITLIVLAVIGITGVRIPLVTNALAKFTVLLKNGFGKFIHRKNYAALLMLGALNGFLPCGLTFLALSFCITLSAPAQGFTYMFLFGVGTLPVMLGLVSIVGLIKNKLQWNVKHLTAGLMILSGVLLIVRVFLLHGHAVHDHATDLVDIVICR